MIKLDEKDRKILDLLQEDGRMQLTVLSRKVGLSIDSTHKRVKKMKSAGVFEATILVDPRVVGYPLTCDVKIKLKNVSEKEYEKFIDYLVAHKNVTSCFSVSGEYDLTIPIVAKDYEDLERISMEIRQRFRDIIADWRSAVNLKVYKFEKYDMKNLK